MTRYLFILFLLGVLVAPGLAEVYTLNPDGTGDFPTIQSAIVNSQHGDIIQLEDGVYNGTGNYNIDFMGRNVTLCSVSGNAENCVIDIEGISGNYISEQGLLLDSGEGPDCVIRDLTIINGDGDGT